MKKPTLHALLVGINEYNFPIGQLKGCVGDVANMMAYLESQNPFFHLNIIHPLLNQLATKKEIITAFNALFKQINPEDTLLFYFAGHGAQEVASPIWRGEEYDSKLESIVCYNSSPHTGSYLIADKEFRYLINKNMGRFDHNKPHILLIFDCCHSGDNTRNTLETGCLPNANVRRLSVLHPIRNWEDFIFYKEFNEYDFTILKSKKFKQEAHIQIAACQDFELAKEDDISPPSGGVSNRQGVFTHYLLKVLENKNGNVTYHELRKRVKIYTKFRYNQIPQIYTPWASHNLLSQGFLNRPVQSVKPIYGNVFWHPKHRWIMDLGALDGVSRRSKGVSIHINRRWKTKGIIEKVDPDFSFLNFSLQDTHELGTTTEYQCQVQGFLSLEPLMIHVNSQGDKDIPELIGTILKRTLNINFTPNELGADFHLHVSKQIFILTYPGQPFKPVVRPINREEGNALEFLCQYLSHMAQWKYLKTFQSSSDQKAVFFNSFPIQLNIYLRGSDGNFRAVPRHSQNELDEFLISYSKFGHEWGGTVKIEFKNQSDRQIYFNLIYLLSDFKVSSSLVPTERQRLDPGESYYLLSERTKNGEIPIQLDEYIRQYNIQESRSFLKIIASTHDNLHMEDLNLNALPSPRILDSANREGPNRGLIKSVLELDISEQRGWMTQCNVLRMPNPEYNRVSKVRLERMLSDPYFQKFALGLYIQPPLSSPVTLKHGISYL